MQLVQKFQTPPLAHLLQVILSLTLAMILPGTAVHAQGLFSPAITVNDDAITYYELEQRAQLYRLLRTPGNPDELARKELIQDRLKRTIVEQAGIYISDEHIATGTNEFAKRVNMSGEEFLAALKQGGVDPETFREFTRMNLVWSDYIRTRYLERSRPTEEEIDRAFGRLGSGGGIRVLLSEIIMPITPQTAEQIEARAEQLSQITSINAFSEAAGKYSATDTRTQGGRMDWLPIANLPPDLRPLLLALRPGEVTPPIPINNAVALFQMRDIQEISSGVSRHSAIEYATYFIAGGQTPDALKTATTVANAIDTCDDLYGIAKDQPAEVLERHSLTPGEIPRDIALELAKMDDGEISTRLTRSNGQTLVLLMLCGRSPALGDDDDARADLTNGLTQQRLNAFSVSLLDQLQADARIVDK